MTLPQKRRKILIAHSEENTDQALINIDYCYKATFNIPLSYKEALNCWTEVMHEEVESLNENAFDLTPLPEGKKTVGSKWFTRSRKTLVDQKDTKQDSLYEDSVKQRGETIKKLFPYCKHQLSAHLNANGNTI